MAANNYKTGDDLFDKQGRLPTVGVIMLTGIDLDRQQVRAELTVSMFRNNRINVYSHVSCHDQNREFSRQWAAISGLRLRDVLNPGPEQALEIQNQVSIFTKIEKNERREYSFTPLDAHPQTYFILNEPLAENGRPWVVCMDYDTPYLSVLRHSREKILDVLRTYALANDRLVILSEASNGQSFNEQQRSAYDGVCARVGRRYRDRWIVDLTEGDPFTV